jgi:glycosyltransferase involved in cell wall biosynthesis
VLALLWTDGVLSVKPDGVHEGLISADRQCIGRSLTLVVLLLQDLKFGGTQRQALELARGLDPSRFRVEIWLMASGDDLVPVARDWKVDLVWLSRKTCVGPESLLSLLGRLKTRQVDLLVLMTVVPNIWGRLLGRLAGVKVIVSTCRGGGSPRRQHERWLSSLVDHHLCNSAALRDLLAVEYGVPRHQITVLSNGVDTDYFRPRTSTDASPCSSCPACSTRSDRVVLSVARLVPDKDHETLIKAFQSITTSFPDARLWLVGDGPRLDALQRLIDTGTWPDRIRISPGLIDLRQVLRQSDIFVLSTHREGLPNVVLEAMASGLPVVATNVGGIPEVVKHGETGWLVPGRDVTALAAAIAHLLSDESARHAFGRSGRKRAEEEYALCRMVRSHEELFHRLRGRNAKGVCR